ncbi:mucin-17 isoform X14 [Oryzias latipes]|uniref:mucin-17 isoform X14 n=1 Tax=Oryzias latipes TaxID=8090 RepID=UPI0005CBFB0B|nr:mucin-17 isoform X14 [Oryzias latipes]
MAITSRLMVISVLLVYLCSVQDVFSEDSATVSSTESLSISNTLNTTPEETSTDDTPSPVTSEPTTAETPTSSTNEATTETSSTTDEGTGTPEATGTGMTTDAGTSDDSPTTAPASTTVDETSPTNGGTLGPTDSSTPSNTDSTTDPDTSTVSEASPQTPFTTNAVTGTSDTGMTTDAGTSDDSPTTAPAGTTVDETSPTSGVSEAAPQTPFTTDTTVDGSIPTSPRTSGPDDTVTTLGTGKTTAPPLSTLPATVGTTVIPTVCQNGGTLDGVTCICLPQFSGSKCEIFVPVTTPVTIKRPVVVNMMLNERFNDKYLNNQSQEYKDFVGNFKKKMTTYYESKIKETFEVVVTKVSPGKPLGKLTVNTVKKRSLEVMATTENLSVNVIHEVILDIPNTAEQAEYNNAFEEIKNATEELAHCVNDCILDVSDTTVEQAGVDLTRSCNGTIYEAILEESKVICVTACNEKHSNPKICYSGGECKVLTEAVCECKNTDTVWYLNDNCSQPLHRIGLIAGLSAAFVVLLASVAALVAFSVLNKRKQIKVKDQKKKQVNLYMEEEVEWPRPNSTGGSNRVGYNNPSYLDDNSGYAKRQTPPHRNSPPPSYPWSRPMTMSDGPTPMPQADQWRNDSGYARPANSAQYQGDIPLDHLMRVRRPQVRSSWDA